MERRTHLYSEALNASKNLLPEQQRTVKEIHIFQEYKFQYHILVQWVKVLSKIAHYVPRVFYFPLTTH